MDAFTDTQKKFVNFYARHFFFSVISLLLFMLIVRKLLTAILTWQFGSGQFFTLVYLVVRIGQASEYEETDRHFRRSSVHRGSI